MSAKIDLCRPDIRPVRMLKLFKNTVFLLFVVGLLTSAAVTASVLALKSAATVAQMSTQAVATAAKHREKVAALTAAHRKQVAVNAAKHQKNMTKAIAKTKAKARLKRVVTMVPVAGIVAGVYFEERDYSEWLVENPGGTRTKYLCEVGELSSEFLDDVLADLPKQVRPSQEMLSEFVPDCSKIDTVKNDYAKDDLMTRIQGYVADVDLPALQEYVPDIELGSVALKAKGYLPEVNVEGVKSVVQDYLDTAVEAVSGR